ncbi:MAG: hypothetical protein ACXIVQ_03310 [Acidimicrobiales bacterium]
MELLPPIGWADVATKHDLAHHAEMTKARIDALETRTESRFDTLDAQLGSRIDMLDARLGARIDTLDARLGTEIADLRTEMHRSLRLTMLVTVGVLGTWISVVGALTGGG